MPNAILPVLLPRMPLHLVQLTDTHLLAEPDGVMLGIPLRDSLRRVVEAIQRDGAPPPDRVLVTGDLSQDGTPASYGAVGQLLASLGVPMQIDGEPVGGLEGLNKTDDTFTDADVATLSVLAAQAAIAIRNARQVQALEEANAKLSRLDELKNDFLSLASHELRTPLSIIKGYGEIVAEEGRADLAPHVHAMVDAAARMETVIDTMVQMDALRLGAEALSIEPVEPVELGDVIAAARDDLLPPEAERNHTVAVDAPDTPIELSADPERLRIVLTHLLKNAYTFTPPSGHVAVSTEQADNAVCVTVRDTGIGLAADDLDRIFDDFYQVEDKRTRAHGGLGLGLTIARKLVRLHGGCTEAESDRLQ